MNLYFTSEIRDCLDLFGSPMALKTCYSYIYNDSVQFQIEIRKISRRPPRFVDTAKLGHFTLLFCRGRQRNVQRFIVHLHSYCFALSLFFGDVFVAVVVVVCLSSLLISYMNASKTSRHVFIQSEVKPKLILTYLHAFSSLRVRLVNFV